MRLLAAGALAGILVLAAVAPRSVSGQMTVTGTPTPTPTATAVPAPSAADLVAAMHKTVVAKNTFRDTLDLSVVVSLQSSVSFKGRAKASVLVSLSPAQERIVETAKESVVSNGKTKTDTIALVGRVVGKQAAVRAGQQSWNCSPTTSTTDPSRAVSYLIGSGLSGGTTMGAETVNGVAVWHVRVDTTAKHVPVVGAAAPKSTPTRVDLYISQADSTLVREVASLSTTKGGGLTAKVTENFDQYGGPVHVTLPPKCKG